MRQLSPAFIVTSLALAIASGNAFAQVSGAGTTRPTTAPASTITGNSTVTAGSSTAPAASTGSCTGTGGSTCSSSTTTSTANSSTAASTPSGPNGLSGASVTSPAPSAGVSSSSSSTGGSGIGAMGTNSTNEVFNPTAGVAANASGMTSGTVVPGAVISVDAGVNANGERGATDNRGAAAVNGTPGVTPTPLFELTARQGAAKQAARRARGDEPRVYGIAPRTDRDLTNQMPDDPIIRY